MDVFEIPNYDRLPYVFVLLFVPVFVDDGFTFCTTFCGAQALCLVAVSERRSTA